MSAHVSLLKKTGIYALGTFGSRILTFLLVPLYSYYLNRDEFGYYDLIITGVSLVVPILTLQIADSVFRWLMTVKDDEDRRGIITNGTLLILVSLGLSFLFFLIYYFINPLPHHWVIFFLVLLSIVYPFFQQITRGMGQSVTYALNGVLFAIIFLIGNLVFLVFYDLGIMALFYASIISYAICSLILMIKVQFWHQLNHRLFNPALCKEFFRYSIPLIPNTISWWAINSGNKYIILFYLGLNANGLFAMASRFPVILLMINQVFLLAWQENAIQSYKKGAEIDNQVLTYLIKGLLGLVFLLSLVSQAVSFYLLSPEYYEAWVYMPILYLGVAFLSFAGYYGAFFLAAKSTKTIFSSTIIAAIITLVTGILVIKPWGLLGISLSILLGYVVLFLLRLRASRQLIRLEFPRNVFLTYGALVLVGFMITYISRMEISVLFCFLGMIYLLYDNRDLFATLLNRIRFK